MGHVSCWDQGDFNYDGIINGIDFGELAANFNKGAGGAQVGLSALSDPAFVAFAEASGLMADVPEPASAGMIVMTGLGILLRRRQSSRQSNRQSHACGRLGINRRHHLT